MLKRINSNPDVQLPASDLLSLFSSSSHSLVSHFCLVFLNIAFDRLPHQVCFSCYLLSLNLDVQDAKRLIVPLISGISSRSIQQQSSMFQILLSIIGSWTESADGDEFSFRVEDIAFVTLKLSDFILFSVSQSRYEFYFPFKVI